MDLLKYPRSRKENKYMLVCVDHFSKWQAVYPIKNKKCATVPDALRDKVLPSLPKVPERVLTDHGKEFLG